jgi:hypothetical protein
MHERGDDPARAAAHLDLDGAWTHLCPEMFLSAGGRARVVAAVGGRGMAEALRGSLDTVLPQIVARACPGTDVVERRKRSGLRAYAARCAGVTVRRGMARYAPAALGGGC